MPAAAADRVVAVEIEGADRVEVSAIRLHISHPIGVGVDQAVVDADIKAVYRMGFFDNVWVVAEPAAAGVVLHYKVRERPYVSEVHFEGVDHGEVEDLEAVIGIRPRTVFDPGKAWKGLAEARKVYADLGYPDASIDYSLEVGEDGEAAVVYNVEEGKVVRIEEIRFLGVNAFSHRKLRRVMSIREEWMFSWATGAGILNDDELATDVERLTAFYYDNGYIHVRVDEPDVERRDDGLLVTVRIEEGPKFLVSAIDFRGDVLRTAQVLRGVSGLEVGDVFQPSHLREAIFALTESYGDLGYAFAEVTPRTNVNEADAEVGVMFDITSNDEVSVRRIDVRGNTKTRDHVVRRELRLEEGGQFSGSGMRRSRAEVRRLGIFDEVEVSTNRVGEDGDEVDLIVKVKEGRTGTFSAGAGFSSADSFILNGRITERNLFGRGQTLSLGLDFGARRQNFRISLTEPWFLDMPLLVGIEIFDWSFEFDRFTRGGRGISLRAQYPLWELGLESLYGSP